MSHPVIRVGQFSESPVLAIARALELNTRFGIDWETQRVQSSPGQFKSLRSNEMDIAITSPDNVLLYATTPNNPLKEQLDVQFLRPELALARLPVGTRFALLGGRTVLGTGSVLPLER